MILRPVLITDRAALFHGDSARIADVLKEHTVDAIVTDPPAGIGFMGKDWDGDKGGRDAWIRWLADTLAGAFRCLKPGGHALVWAIPRTSHWTAMALETAGFEVRDVVVHLFGTGFPKSLDVSKAIDKAAGAERAVIGSKLGLPGYSAIGTEDQQWGGLRGDPAKECQITAPATSEAAQWSGWGTALKPAAEHWILARKPLAGTVAANVLEYGTGGLNIDGCRIGTAGGGTHCSWWDQGQDCQGHGGNERSQSGDTKHGPCPTVTAPEGRWPANVTLDEDAAAMLDAQSGINKSPTKVTRGGERAQAFGMARQDDVPCYGDTGGASRFFYVAKPSPSERDAGLAHLPARTGGEATDREDGTDGLKSPRAGAGRTGGRRNFHPTVKSIALMRWLVRLVTPPGGIVLDPFCGSGSTGVAAIEEGFSFVGVELTDDYVPIAEGRLRHTLDRSPGVVRQEER